MPRLTLLALLLLSILASASTPDVDRQSLFIANHDGYASYRIPSLLCAGGRTVLAFCEARRNSAADTGSIDIVLKRSQNGGKTFGNMQIVWSDGQNTCGNPCAVRDDQTGILWLLMTHNLAQDHEKQIVAGASKGPRTVWVTSSSDDGLTWDKPREITADVKKPDWMWLATGPGVGIQLKTGPHRGRLVIPCDHISLADKDANAHVIYSDDHGKAWKLGASPPDGRFNESQSAELQDGRLMLSMRPSGGDLLKRRGIALSDDGGETFSPTFRDNSLPDPICQGSILRYDRETEKTILFSNPASDHRRENMTVRLSDDDGKTWSAQKVVHAGPSAYSCLAILPDGNIGLLYEAGEEKPYERIEFAAFNLEWLKEKK